MVKKIYPMHALNFSQKWWSSPKTLAILVAVFLILFIFPDVIFFNATISGHGIYSGTLHQTEVIKLLPELPHRSANQGFTDMGGSAFQSEPMIQFIKHVLYNFESPYWNPYSGAGALGPETLVDQKFSFFTLLVALSGGSELAFHIVLLGLYAVAIYFLYLLSTQFFGISRLGAVTASVVYMLNGYNIANLNSNVSQIYLYFPMVLYALCAFSQSRRTKYFIALVLANIIALSTTFFPSSVMVFMSIYIIAFGFTLSLWLQNKQSLSVTFKLSLLQGLSVLLALLALSFVYLPIIESFWVVDAVEMYQARVFYPAKRFGLLSLFSAKHFWESYNAAINPLMGNVVFHMGIVSSVVCVAAFTRWKFWKSAIVIAASLILFLSVGRIFGVHWIAKIIDNIFGLKSIGCQYWWGAVAVTFPILVGFGFDAIQEKRALWLPMLIVYAVIIGSVIYHSNAFDLNLDCRKFSIKVLGIFVLASLYLVVKMRSIASKKWVTLLSALLSLLIFAELTYYVNHYRHKRMDIFHNPFPEVAYLKEHSGLYRVANIGPYALTPEYGSAYQIQQIESINMNVFPAYRDFFQRYFLPDASQRWGIFPSFHVLQDKPLLDLQMLNFLGVKYIVLPFNFANYSQFLTNHNYVKVFQTAKTMIFENLEVYPRIFAVSTLVSWQNQIPQTGEPWLRKVAFTQDKQLLAEANRIGVEISRDLSKVNELKKMPDNSVTLLSYHNGNIMAKANLDRPAVVVLPDNWHSNWKAFVNGKSAYIGIVNESFRGIALPKGSSVIEMQYRPKTLTVAIIISIASLLVLIGLGLMRRRIDNWLDK